MKSETVNNDNNSNIGLSKEQEKQLKIDMKRFKNIMDRQKDSFDEFDNDEDIDKHIKLVKI